MKTWKKISILSLAVFLLLSSTGAAYFFFDKYEITIQKKKTIPQRHGAMALALPGRMHELNAAMAKEGVIDLPEFQKIYALRGGFTPEMSDMMDGTKKDDIKVTEANADYVLNLLWALGLSNKNEILETGPMMNPEYGGAGNFASTGGWSLSKGDSMEHYSKHQFITLTPEQQQLVASVAKNIYRPCCNNPVHFPDCNHGMAMLGFLELLAADGDSEEELYEKALTLNRFWFPDTYEAIDQYLALPENMDKKVTTREILGPAFSSASGYRRILLKVVPPESKRSGGCSV